MTVTKGFEAGTDRDKILTAMLHLDFFFLFGFWVQVLVLQGYSLFLPIGIPGIFLTIPALVLVAVAVRRESRRHAIAAAVLLLLEMILLAGRTAILQIIRIAPPYDTFTERIRGYGLVAIILLLATSVVAINCWRNFNKGLKSHLQQATLPSAEVGRFHTADEYPHGSQDQRLLNRRMQLV